MGDFVIFLALLSKVVDALYLTFLFPNYIYQIAAGYFTCVRKAWHTCQFCPLYPHLVALGIHIYGRNRPISTQEAYIYARRAYICKIFRARCARAARALLLHCLPYIRSRWVVYPCVSLPQLLMSLQPGPLFPPLTILKRATHPS